jgi:hypothetical protein
VNGYGFIIPPVSPLKPVIASPAYCLRLGRPLPRFSAAGAPFVVFPSKAAAAALFATLAALLLDFLPLLLCGAAGLLIPPSCVFRGRPLFFGASEADRVFRGGGAAGTALAERVLAFRPVVAAGGGGCGLAFLAAILALRRSGGSGAGPTCCSWGRLRGRPRRRDGGLRGSGGSVSASCMC